MNNHKPLMIEMFSGLSGWGEGGLAAGFQVRGYDIVDMHAQLGFQRPEGIELVLRDVRSIHGSELKDAFLICASPPCQEPSYRAMCWKKAKALTPAVKPDWWKKPEGKMNPRELREWTAWKRDHPLPPPVNFIELFNECFRIQREACAAAGRYIPMVVENVRGAQAWVGRAAWHWGSFYLWADVPALMPVPASARNLNKGNFHRSGEPKWARDDGQKVDTPSWSEFKKTGKVSAHWRMEGLKLQEHINIRDGHSHTRHLTNPAEHDGVKVGGTHDIGSAFSWNMNEDFQASRREGIGNATDHKIAGAAQKQRAEGVKQGGDWFDESDPNSISRTTGSKSPKRKAAAAKIAKIPFTLAFHIAQAYYPHAEYNRCHETHTVVAAVDAAGSGIGADVHLPLRGVQ